MKKLHKQLLLLSLGVLIATFLLYDCSKRKKIEEKINQGDYLRSQKDIESLIQAIGKYEEAVVLALEAVKKSFEAQKLLGIQFAFERHHQKCVETLEKAKKIKSQDAILHYYLGLCYTHLAQNESEQKAKYTYITKAQKTFEVGLQIDNDEHLLHYGLGILTGFIIKKNEKAIKHLEKALELNNEDPNVIFSLANLYWQAKYTKKAVTLYRKIMVLFPKNSKQNKQARENIISMGLQP